MHNHCEVWFEDLPADTPRRDVDERIRRLFGPYNEESKSRLSPKFWDWLQVGGRWTGAHDGHDPEEDPANHEVCDLCGGTGKRKDMEAHRGCNGCSGTGVKVKWPTEWAPWPGDVMETDKVRKGLTCHTLMLVPKGVHGRRGGHRVEPEILLDLDGKVRKVLAERGLSGGTLVTVDCHS